MKGHELPLRAPLHQPHSPPSSATAAGEAGAHADAALPTLPLPHGAQLPFRCTQGRAPGRPFPGTKPSPSHPSTERARPSLLTAHQPLLTLPARTAAKVFPFHWEGKKMSTRPQYPAPEPAPPLPPGSRLWTLHLGTRPGPCRPPRNTAPASVPSPLRAVDHCVQNHFPPKLQQCCRVPHLHKLLTHPPFQAFPAPPGGNCSCQVISDFHAAQATRQVSVTLPDLAAGALDRARTIPRLPGCAAHLVAPRSSLPSLPTVPRLSPGLGASECLPSNLQPGPLTLHLQTLTLHGPGG